MPSSSPRPWPETSPPARTVRSTHCRRSSTVVLNTNSSSPSSPNAPATRALRARCIARLEPARRNSKHGFAPASQPTGSTCLPIRRFDNRRPCWAQTRPAATRRARLSGDHTAGRIRSPGATGRTRIAGPTGRREDTPVARVRVGSKAGKMDAAKRPGGRAGRVNDAFRRNNGQRLATRQERRRLASSRRFIHGFCGLLDQKFGHFVAMPCIGQRLALEQDMAIARWVRDAGAPNPRLRATRRSFPCRKSRTARATASRTGHAACRTSSFTRPRSRPSRSAAERAGKRSARTRPPTLFEL